MKENMNNHNTITIPDYDHETRVTAIKELWDQLEPYHEPLRSRIISNPDYRLRLSENTAQALHEIPDLTPAARQAIEELLALAPVSPRPADSESSRLTDARMQAIPSDAGAQDIPPNMNVSLAIDSGKLNQILKLLVLAPFLHFQYDDLVIGRESLHLTCQFQLANLRLSHEGPELLIIVRDGKYHFNHGGGPHELYNVTLKIRLDFSKFKFMIQKNNQQDKGKYAAVLQTDNGWISDIHVQDSILYKEDFCRLLKICLNEKPAFRNWALAWFDSDIAEAYIQTAQKL